MCRRWGIAADASRGDRQEHEKPVRYLRGLRTTWRRSVPQEKPEDLGGLKMSRPKIPVKSIIVATGLALSAWAYSADENATTTPPSNAPNAAANQQTRATEPMHAMRASKLIGKEVRNAQNEKLGEIKDLVVDVNNDEVYYAVLSFGGFMGMGDKLFAYPLRVFAPGQNPDQLVLNVDKQKLKDSPGFESKRWPDWNKDTYRAEVDRYYRDQVALQPKPNMVLRRASHLIGADVLDSNGKDVGDVRDVVVDLQTSKVQFVAVKLDKGWGKADQLTELPLRAFRPSANDRDKLVLRVTQQQIGTAPGFPSNRWPNMEGSYRSDVDAWFTGLGIDTTASSDRPTTDTQRRQ
jgi:sporulation protein YlmC with PRC-barrel domain